MVNVQSLFVESRRSVEAFAEVAELAAALASGLPIIGDVDSRTVLDGSSIRAALLAADGEGDPRGFEVRRCLVRGWLDLSNMTIHVPLSFVDCVFDAPMSIDGADLRSLHFTDCTLSGLQGNGVRIRRDLVIDRTKIRAALATLGSTHHTAAVWLCEADIGGRVLVRASIIDGGGGRSVHADRIRVGANLRFLNGSSAVGELRLLSARIAGSIDIVASSVTAENEIAIELAEAQLGGSIFITDDRRYSTPTCIDGIIVLSDVKVGAFLRIKGVTLNGRTARGAGPFDRLVRHASCISISAPRCEVGDDLVIDADCDVTGALLWPHATVLGDVVLSGLTIRNAADRSLDFGGADIRGSLLGRGLTSIGTTWLAGARIGASIVLEGATFSDANGRSVMLATGIHIAGDLQLDDVTVTGGSMRFRAARIGGEIDARKGTWINPGGETLSLSHADVGGAVRLTDITSRGLLSINRASIGGRLRLTGADLTCDMTWDKNPDGDALEVISAELRGGMNLDWKVLSPSLDFFSSRTTVVADVAARWPARAELSGFIYERFDTTGTNGRSAWDLRDRLAILASQTPFDLGPYEHAAQVYRSHGRFSDAEAILIAGRRRAVSDEVATMSAPSSPAKRRLMARWLRLGNRMYDASVRFGFRPARALGLIAGLIALVWLSLVGPWSARDNIMRATGPTGVIYSPVGPVGSVATRTALCGDGAVRCFRSTIYAIETVIPLVDLGQRSTWYVESTKRHGTLYDLWLTFSTLAGWALSTVFLLSFSRIGRSS